MRFSLFSKTCLFSFFYLKVAFSSAFAQQVDSETANSSSVKEKTVASDAKEKAPSSEASDSGGVKEKAQESDAKEKEEESPPKIGNFALPASQQPSALFGFGGNIIDEEQIQVYFFGDDFNGRKKYTIDLIPSILFGITKDVSIYFNFPVTPLLQDGKNISRGLEDFFVQVEYAFYNKSNKKYVDQATLVGNLTFPTGSKKKSPNTGFGAPSFFIGTTYYRTYIQWIFFTSHGAVLTTSDHHTKFGDQFLYQFGIGRNFASNKKKIYAWMVELDGQYNRKNRIHGAIDKNSGGNVLYLTPSIWFSNKDYLFQFGGSIPLDQSLFGKQRKFHYALNLNFAWSYY